MKTELSPELLDDLIFNLKGEIQSETGPEMEVEFTSDRPDIMCATGFARAAKGYLGIEVGPVKYATRETDFSVFVDTESLASIRPFCDFAVVYGVNFDGASLKDILWYQEKLHSTLSSGRLKFAIGVHDVSNLVTHELRYSAAEPSQIRFTPLNSTKEMSGLEILSETEKGREYSGLLSGMPKVPVFSTADGTVLSMPPIINSELTHVTERTTTVLVDVTGNDQRLTEAVCAMMAHNLCELGGLLAYPRITDGNGVRGRRKDREIVVSVRELNSVLGTSLSPEEAIALLAKARIGAARRGNGLRALVPPYRVDLLSAADIFEEVAVFGGYQNLMPELPRVPTRGGLHTSTKITAAARRSLGSLGFVEYNGLLLGSLSDFSGVDSSFSAIEVSNPFSAELNCLRPLLYPQILRLVFRNQNKPKPIRAFMVGPVSQVVDGGYVQSIHAAAAICDNIADAPTIEGYFTQFCRDLGLFPELNNSQVEPLISGRCAKVLVDGKEVGIIGEVKPKLLLEMRIDYPVALFEVEIYRYKFDRYTLV
ncbi:MAG: phenylalanine--tRNA ligase subunit beta [Thermoprotei archaeon]